MTSSLKFLSEDALHQLSEKVPEHLDRYASGDFVDLAEENGWAIELKSVKVDWDALKTLDGSSNSASLDVANAKKVYAALQGMTPAVAAEERIWVRLTHVECLSYSRQRWLSGKSGDKLESSVHRRMFARGRTGIRDDNALSRLWWNMHIATLADPSDPVGALELIVRRADIRLQFVERPNTAARRALASAIVRGMRRDPSVYVNDDVFSDFMVAMNRKGGGILFEALPESASDAFIDTCIAEAKAKSGL